MLKTKKLIFTILIISLIALVGCDISYDFDWNNEIETNNDLNETNSNSDKDNDLDDIDSNSVNFTTVADIKAEFDTLMGTETKNKYMFKPFYNVEQTTEFTFSFKSKVDPIKAVTVHTDKKCDYLSLVWQINEGYWTEDGIDVVVKPTSNNATLYTEGREGAKTGIWGYAPIYFLCIRYDLESTEVKKLETPIVIPFTVKNEISTPTIYANIDSDGTFSIKWNKVEGAAKYKVYSASDSRIDSYTLAETGYQTTPELLATIDSSKLEFNPGHLLMQEKVVLGGTAYPDNTVREKDEEYGIEIVDRQNENLYNFHTFFVTAVDSRGNESNFAAPVRLENYKDSLPKKIDELYNKNVTIKELADTIKVKSVDMKTVYEYPINYYKIGETKEYSTSCDYRYEVVGTALKGIVSYANEEKIFPEEHISNFNPKASLMPQNTMDKIPQITIDTFADSEYSNSNINITGNVNYPENAKVKLDPGKVYLWTDKDLARRTIGTPEIGATDPREEIDSFIYDGNPEYIVKREGNVITVEKVEKNEVGNDTPNKEEKPTEKPNEEVKEEKPSKIEKEEAAKEIDNSNYVEEQKKSTEKQVEKADKEKIKTTNYPIFANTAGQKYLALSLINHEEEISLKAFPEYQVPEELIDDLYYVWYQNPYIMTIDLKNTFYLYETQTLKVEYGVSEKETKEYQEAVYNKSKKVVKDIIKPGMSDNDKVIAIYEYLEKNAKYNNDALEYGMAGNEDIYQKYPNSWNTYGILCEGLGVCQSYAYAFNILAYESGLESVMVVGTLNNGGHAWNAVNLNKKWYMVDPTNNAVTSNLPYWICNASSDFLADVNFKLDDRFVDGGNENIIPYINIDSSQDWYYINGLYAKTPKECANIWFKNKDANEILVIKHPIKTESEINNFIIEFKEEVSRLGVTNEELGKYGMQTSGGIVIIKKIR